MSIMGAEFLISPSLPYGSWTSQENNHSYINDSYSFFGALPRLLLQIGRSSLSFELPLGFEQAAAYRKANGQYVRKNQWRDTAVRVFIDLD